MLLKYWQAKHALRATNGYGHLSLRPCCRPLADILRSAIIHLNETKGDARMPSKEALFDQATEQRSVEFD